MNDCTLRARSLVAQALELRVENVGDDASIETMDAWDSMGHLRIVFEIERELGVELEGEQIIELESVEDVARLIEQLQPVTEG